MPQYASPTADVITTSFASQTGATGSLYTYIDDSDHTPDNADYIVCNTSPSNNVYVCKLGALSDPLTNTGHVISFTYARSVDTNAEQIDLNVGLFQDYASEVSKGTMIANTDITDIPYGWTSNTLTLSGAQAESITDYANLFLRFVFNVPA